MHPTSAAIRFLHCQRMWSDVDDVLQSDLSQGQNNDTQFKELHPSTQSSAYAFPLSLSQAL